MDCLLQAQGLRRIYDHQERPGVDGISLTVARGEFLGIMGASGSGKTTLLQMLSTLDTPSAGQAFLDGIELSSLTPRQAADVRRERVGFIFQDYLLLDSLTVRENIAVPLVLLHRPAAMIEPAVRELALLFMIEDQLSKYPYELSGGQRQRVAAARALVKRPLLLFADEPTGALDSESAATLLSALAQANRQLSTTVLMVTHDPTAASFAGRILFLRDGKILCELRREGRERADFYEAILQETARQARGGAQA